MLPRIIFIFLLLVSAISLAQKKSITHKDYDLWKTNSNVKISDNGKLVVSVVELVTERGDGYLEIYNTVTGKKFIFPRGYNPSIAMEGLSLSNETGPRYIIMYRLNEALVAMAAYKDL